MDAYLQSMVSCHLYTAIIRQTFTDIEHSPAYTAVGLPLTHQVRW